MPIRRALLLTLNRSTTVERCFRHRPFLVAKGTHMKRPQDEPAGAVSFRCARFGERPFNLGTSPLIYGA